MPDENNFSRDLQDVPGGSQSELYRSVAPMVDGPEFENLQGYDREKIDKLRTQMHQGMTGLEYLTGIKHNKAETFYDAHPVQATITDATKYAPVAGLGLSAAILGKDYLSVRAARKTDTAAGNATLTDSAGGQFAHADGSDVKALRGVLGAGTGDPAVDGVAMQRRRQMVDLLQAHAQEPPPFTNAAGHPENYDQHYSGVVQSAHQSLVDYENFDAAYRTQVADGSMTPKAYKARMAQLQEDMARKFKGHDKQLEAIMSQLNDENASNYIKRLGSMHTTVRANPTIGKLTGEDLQKNTWLPDWAKKALPGYQQERLGHMAHKFTLDTHGQYSKGDVVRNIIGDAYGVGGTAARSLDTESGRTLDALERGAFTHLDDITTKGKRGLLGTIFNRVKFPVAAGGGLALGGMGLHKLLQLIQGHMYGDEKMQEWKRNLLKSRAQFDEAAKIK